MAAIVSIGRNLYLGQLDDESWESFKSDLIDALAFTYSSAIYFQGEGIGTFEGRTEQSFTVVFDERWPGNYSLEVLLKVLAARYGQESIALTRGETVLVEAATPGEMTISDEYKAWQELEGLE